MEQLKALLPDDPHFAHVCDFFLEGTNDDVWIPRIGQEGGWIVITTDRGKGSARGGKLPRLCLENKITHVLLSPALHRKKGAEKVGALVLLWGQIEGLSAEVPGTRFVIRYRDKRDGKGLHLVLEKQEPK